MSSILICCCVFKEKNNTLPILFQQQETKLCKSTLFDLSIDDIDRSESRTQNITDIVK